MKEKRLPSGEYNALVFIVPEKFWERDWPWRMTFLLNKLIGMDKKRREQQKK